MQGGFSLNVTGTNGSVIGKYCATNNMLLQPLPRCWAASKRFDGTIKHFVAEEKCLLFHF